MPSISMPFLSVNFSAYRFLYTIRHISVRPRYARTDFSGRTFRMTPGHTALTQHPMSKRSLRKISLIVAS